MTKYDAQDFLGMTGLTTEDIPIKNVERFIEVAIGLLNLYEANLPDKMTGTDGAKYLNMDGAQWAALVQVTNMVYIDLMEDAGGDMDVQGLSLRASRLLTKPQTMAVIEGLAIKCARISKDPYKNILLV